MPGSLAGRRVEGRELCLDGRALVLQPLGEGQRATERFEAIDEAVRRYTEDEREYVRGMVAALVTD